MYIKRVNSSDFLDSVCKKKRTKRNVILWRIILFLRSLWLFIE